MLKIFKCYIQPIYHADDNQIQYAFFNKDTNTQVHLIYENKADLEKFDKLMYLINLIFTHSTKLQTELKKQYGVSYLELKGNGLVEYDQAVSINDLKYCFYYQDEKLNTLLNSNLFSN